MKKRVRVMQKYSKEGIMVNKNQRRMSIIEIHLQQDLPHSGNKEASTIMKEIHRREDHDQPRQEFRRTTPQRRSFTPRYVNLFYGHCFYCTNFGHKVADCRAYGRNVQARNAYVAPHNIECYKFHNYGHIARDCRSMMDTSMKENIDIRYKKVWKRKQEAI
jgi:hypothetical protein